jgi:hypothetical protein
VFELKLRSTMNCESSDLFLNRAIGMLIDNLEGVASRTFGLPPLDRMMHPSWNTNCNYVVREVASDDRPGTNYSAGAHAHARQQDRSKPEMRECPQTSGATESCVRRHMCEFAYYTIMLDDGSSIDDCTGCNMRIWINNGTGHHYRTGIHLGAAGYNGRGVDCGQQSHTTCHKLRGERFPATIVADTESDNAIRRRTGSEEPFAVAEHR